MPGKVNPTQCEALTMVACRVHGNQAAVSMASSQGRFELNVYAPILADSFIESVKLLSEAIHSFDIHCAQGIQVNEDRMEELVEKSLMLVTALSPHIGYEKSPKIAKKAFADNSSLKEAALDLGYVTEEEYDHIKTHVVLTHDILSKINTSKSFEDVIQIASSHHEKFDGKGTDSGRRPGGDDARQPRSRVRGDDPQHAAHGRSASAHAPEPQFM